jgi:ATP-dependent DNA helicase RecQ
VAEHWHDACADLQKRLEKCFENLLKVQDGFSFDSYFTRVAFHAPQKEVIKQYVPPVRETSSNENPHPELYARLRLLTEAIMLREDLPVYRVASKHTLQLICQVLPQTPGRLSAISGFKRWKTEMFGDEFLEEIKAYCEEKGIVPTESEMPPPAIKQKPKEKKPAYKGATQQATYDLYKQGKTIAEIAEERSLASSTIESHLAAFVKAGELKVEDFVSPQKIAVIERELPDELESFAMTPVKEKLGNDFSYGEIKMVLAWKQAQLAKAATLQQEITGVV